MSHPHDAALAEMVKKTCAALKDHLRPKASVTQEIEDAIRAAHDLGIGYAIESEGKAWQRVTVLEDALTEIVRHAPGGTMAKAKALAAGIETALAETAEA